MDSTSSRRPRASRASLPVVALVALAVVSFACGASCGGASSPPSAPAAGGSAGPVVVTPPPAADLSPVPDPQGLVATGRIAKLSASFEVMHGWSKLPMPGAEQVTELLTGEAVGAVADLDQPVDFAIAIAGKFPSVDVLTAVSAAVKDPDRTKALLSERYKLIAQPNGVTVIQGLGRPSRSDGDDDDGDDDKGDKSAAAPPDRTCELAPSFGPSPTRIVCAWSSRALTELGPWLTRTATRATTTSDAHAELRIGPLKDRISLVTALLASEAGGLLGGAASAASAPALDDTLRTTIAELGNFARDLDVVSVDLTLRDPGATTALTVKFGSTTSEIARAATAHPERNGPVPDAFWQLPADADAAFFSRGVGSDEVAKWIAAGTPLLASVLADAGIKEADRKAIAEALGKLASGAAGLYASGTDAETVRKAFVGLSPAGGLKDDAAIVDAKHTLLEALLGWRVLERDEPATAVLGALKDLAASWQKPAVLAAVRAKSKGTEPPTLRTAPLPKGVALPAGSVHYVLEFAPPGEFVPSPAPLPPDSSKKAKPKPVKAKPIIIHLLVAPEGQRSWVGVGGDEGVCASHLALSMSSKGDKLAGRADLAGLKQDANVGEAGFFTLRGIGETLLIGALLGGDSAQEIHALYEKAQQLPHQATSVIPFAITPQTGTAGSLASVVATLTVPKGSIEDLVTAVVQHGGF